MIDTSLNNVPFSGHEQDLAGILITARVCINLGTLANYGRGVLIYKLSAVGATKIALCLQTVHVQLKQTRRNQ